MVYIQALFLLFSLVLTFSFFIYGFNHYFLLGVNKRYHLPGIKKENFSKRPFVDVQLPIFNERYVVKRLVSACVGMVERYGTSDAQITILDDSTDDTVQIVDEVVREFTLKGILINVQRRPTRQGYKAGALQLALESTSAEFLTIFDADYTPTEDFLIRTIPYFLEDDTLGIIQSRWTHLNRWFNPITRAVAIGIDVHFFIEQTGRYATGCFLNFNGSGGVLRRSASVQASGWQSDMPG
jgi:cellulose synthase/poly-beta-1,6-N-acetylglucosamine synthase-like glycosyltransferase